MKVVNQHDEVAHADENVRNDKNMFACADEFVGCANEIVARTRNVFANANFPTADCVCSSSD
jgi:hypothetical protein